MRMVTDDAPTPVETWCVCTEDGRRYVLDYAGNGGFGPVTMWSNGLLVPVVYRHLFQPDNADCPACVDPTQANTYLPSIRWETPNPTITAIPGSGDPDRGAFVAVFRGGPDYERMWAEVVRRDWWHQWCDYAVVDLDPQGDWRSAFDTWRRLTTCHRPESSGSRAKVAATEQQPTRRPPAGNAVLAQERRSNMPSLFTLTDQDLAS